MRKAFSSLYIMFANVPLVKSSLNDGPELVWDGNAKEHGWEGILCGPCSLWRKATALAQAYISVDEGVTFLDGPAISCVFS